MSEQAWFVVRRTYKSAPIFGADKTPRALRRRLRHQ